MNKKALDWRAWAARALHLLPRENLSRNIGWLADRTVPQPVLTPIVDAYVRFLDIDVDEVDMPLGGFANFNAFFTRRLLPNARPLDPDPNAVLCPADGKLEELTRVRAGASVRVKGHDYHVADLVGNTKEAERYIGGYAFLVYLSPRDYHRVHAPVGGQVKRIRHVPGTLYPVNRIGLEHVPGLFARNERVTLVTESERFGAVSTILVGAFGVGRIGISVRAPTAQKGTQTINRGDELGLFYMGSSVLVLVPGGQNLVTVRQAGDKVRFGTALARRGGRA